MAELYINPIESRIEDGLTEKYENSQKEETTILPFTEQAKKIKLFLKLHAQLSNTDSALSVECNGENGEENSDKDSDTEVEDSDDEAVCEGEDSEDEALYEDGGFESGGSEERTEVTVQGPALRMKESYRTTQYHYNRPAPEKTFLTIVSQMKHEGKDEAAIVSHLVGFIAKIQALPNRQTILHKLICQPESSGILQGVHLLTFCAVTDMEKLTVLIVKVILHSCFPTPGHAIPYLRLQDEEGNTILHNIVLLHHQASIHTLKSLLSFRYKTPTNLVFVFNPLILNHRGQHPVHLAMNKPVFTKEIFDIFNCLNMNILKLADNLGNNLLHYLVLNCENITVDKDSVEEKVEHIRSYLRKILAYTQVRESLTKLNHNGQNAMDLLESREELETSLRSCLREELELAVLDLLPDSPDSGYGAPSPDTFSWTCTSMFDPDCNATFATSDQVREHMRQVHSEDDPGMAIDDVALDFEPFLNVKQ